MTISRVYFNSHRRFWAWLNIVWNRVDTDRISKVGPDRACAEWLMRNGAFVKWTDDNEFLKDYNALPMEGDVKHIKEIDATDASIMHYGFQHFNGCKHINRIKFHRCMYLQDEALEGLSCLKNSLQDLQIISCGNITDRGVKSLRVLSKLLALRIHDLPYLKNKEDCLAVLKPALPNCDIEILDRFPRPQYKEPDQPQAP
ncbi:ATP synthase subunit s, mitochondrial [Periplaneta americana]|uniref:ATP synthase subunit s, mitochondrial n=1 Tax=Periplaneta americana TaxID=6978 RepID=UPI0037E91049